MHKHILKPQARQILGARWAKYPFSRCRHVANQAPSAHEDSSGILFVIKW